MKNPLLAKTNLVLFLNKCDVLRAKLNAGIRLGKYVISYSDRPNDFEHASDCKHFFLSLHHISALHYRPQRISARVRALLSKLARLLASKKKEPRKCSGLLLMICVLDVY